MSIYGLSKIAKRALETRVTLASDDLRAVPGVGTGLFGMTPDSVKRSHNYRVAKRCYDDAFATLRAFNARHARQYREEIRAERKGR